MRILDKFLELLTGEERRPPTDDPEQQRVSEPEIRYEEIPGTLDLGWRYSEEKNELQMAKVSRSDRSTHMYVIGATGSGKTKFVEFLIQQDIKERNGFGVIDPHGDLTEDIKGFLANSYDEEELAERVVLIDPTDKNSTVTFNPLEKIEGVTISEQVNELVGSFRKIWSDSWGARMEDLMRNSMIALGESGYTLVDLPVFLSRRAFRNLVLRKVTHPIAVEYFTRFEAMTDRAQATWVEPVMNKINALLSDERIRQIFSAPESSFSLRNVIDTRKILLIKLDKGKLKGSADLLGALLLSKVQMAAFSRSDLPQRKRIPFYLYIDEFQNFATESFSLILSEARKYGLALVMAHQTLAQIPDELRSLILGNAGLQVCFRLNRQDASLLAKEAFSYSGREVKGVSSFSPIYWSFSEEWEKKTEELQDLRPRFCYVKHKTRGGLILIQTSEIEQPWTAAGMGEDEFWKHLESLPFGNRYLKRRADLEARIKERRDRIRGQLLPKGDGQDEPFGAERMLKDEPVAETSSDSRKAGEPGKKSWISPIEVPNGRSETQHRYLQNLIKRTAEDKGYRATVEAVTPDGKGRVDIVLERENERIACEISSTTDERHETENIKKCLLAGYGEVIMCSPDRKKTNRIKALVTEQLGPDDQAKVLFFTPEELTAYFIAKGEVIRESKIKGYKVKVQYPGGQNAEKRKRQAVADVILKSFRRLKNDS